MAETEMESSRSGREELLEELLSLTVGGEDSHRTRCVMEIRAGTVERKGFVVGTS